MSNRDYATQLNDLGWEFGAGILDVWRRPKPAHATMARVNSNPSAILVPRKRNVWEGDTAQITPYVIDDGAGGRQLTLRVQLRSADGAGLWSYAHQLLV